MFEQKSGRSMFVGNVEHERLSDGRKHLLFTGLAVVI
jgi:hypothetical protein